MEVSKKITDSQIRALAREFGIEKVAALRAVIEVECRGNGFLPNGEPVILYESFWAYRLIRAKNQTAAEQLANTYPDLFTRQAPRSYGKMSEQHSKLQRARAALDIFKNGLLALQSCSWGMGQVMGFNYEVAGFTNFQSFINAMFADEYQQVKAMLNFIKNKDLVKHMNARNWAEFAEVYNGSNYRRFKYDEKLAAAYTKNLKLE